MKKQKGGKKREIKSKSKSKIHVIDYLLSTVRWTLVDEPRTPRKPSASYHHHLFQTIAIIKTIRMNLLLIKIATLLYTFPCSQAFVPLLNSRFSWGYGKTQSSLDMAATLYGSQGSRSPLVNWAAYEVGFPLSMGDLSKNPHPFRQIPGKIVLY